MEHRYCRRIETDEKVLIYQGGLPVAIGCLRNIGRYGLFIESEYVDVGVNQPLEIELLSHHRFATGRSRCRATVMHKAEGGFGLAVCEECAASLDILAEQVRRGLQSGDVAASSPLSAAARSYAV